MKEFTKYRADGWPFCPNCGKDELWLVWNGKDERPLLEAYINAVLQCYYCGWSDEPPIITRIDERGDDDV